MVRERRSEACLSAHCEFEAITDSSQSTSYHEILVGVSELIHFTGVCCVAILKPSKWCISSTLPRSRTSLEPQLRKNTISHSSKAVQSYRIPIRVQSCTNFVCIRKEVSVEVTWNSQRRCSSNSYIEERELRITISSARVRL
jgi:hypothetical protein